ncbi:hypothetical protein [Bradyrhizobium valentinum]|nr:hypothetical protein [Bradyrhizobium valentinum]
MIDIAKKKALRNFRKQQAKRGMERSEAANEAPKKGIFAALCRSPLVGIDLNLARSRNTGRKIDL